MNIKQIILDSKHPDYKDIITHEHNISSFILDSNNNNEERVEILLLLKEKIPTIIPDILARLRDITPFISDDEHKLSNHINFIEKIIKLVQLNCYDKLACCLIIFNNDLIEHIDVFYKLLQYLIYDQTFLLKYKIEAIKFLIFSNIEEYIQCSHKLLLEIIADTSLLALFRYQIIASFNAKTALSSLLNFNKIKIKYDEEFLFSLQNEFFWNLLNDNRYRLLSGQHLLEMNNDIVIMDMKIKITEELLRIFDVEMDYNIRADVADVISRLGQPVNIRIRGQHLINILGEKNQYYEDKQNIHNSSINSSAQRYIRSIVKHDPRPTSYTDIHSAISECIYKNNIPAENRIKIFKSLDRINIDTATFTDYRITCADFLGYIWNRIQKHDYKNELENRLIEELIDMADTCSTGHINRLVNVFSGFDENVITISWKDQIKANKNLLIERYIKDMKDDELKEDIIIGMSLDSEQQYKDKYNRFISNLNIEEQLYKEFVSPGYVSEKEFKLYYNES